MLLIIGLDGADWRILDPWLRDGSLPTLAALKSEGRWGNLTSTIRPESSIAWTTFATGVNAGKHGIFGFIAQRPDDYAVTLNTAASVRAPTFWARAATAGRKIALLNLPMTYPPRAFPNGSLIAGMLTPDVRSSFTYPPELRDALLDAVPNYVINVERTGMKLQPYIRATTAVIRARGQAARWLMQQDDWDAMVVVFSATDRLQHAALHLLHPEHPRHDPAEARKLMPDLLAAYQAIDEALAELLEEAGPDATVIILSDHGFTPTARAFYVNTWLREQGWLTLRDAPRSRAGLWQKLRRHPGLRRLKRRLPLVQDIRRPPAPAPWLSSVDWTQTRAIYSPVGGIRFNVRGREPQGIVAASELEHVREELMAQLQTDAIDPETKTLPFGGFFPREELYAGPYLSNAPDIILDARREDSAARNSLIRARLAPEPFGDSGDLTGNHAAEGIILAYGASVQRPSSSQKGPSIHSARLMDLAPTILHLLGLAIPPEMDGQVLDFVRGDVTSAEASDVILSPHTTPDLSDEDQDIIQERLRSLGYL